MKSAIFATLSMTAVLSGSANAAVISPTGVIDTNADTFTAGGAPFAASNLITGSHAATLADAPGDTGNWVSNDPAPGGGDYFADAAGDPVLVFDLGSDMSIDQIYIWAYSNGTGAGGTSQGNSLSDFSLRFATDAAGTAGFGLSPLNPSYTAGPSTPTNGGPQPVQTFNFGSNVTARYVEMTITDNYSGAANTLGGDRVGAAEVAFNAVPEPSSTALLGLGGLALILRRRK